MLTKQINDYFGINVEKGTTYRSTEAFQAGKYTYLLVPVDHLDNEQLYELKQLEMYMRAKGDQSIAEFVMAKSGQIAANINQKNVVLLRYFPRSFRKSGNLPKDLAIFHKTGRGFPQKLTKVNRIGQWKFLWEKRLDQMELFWNEKARQHPNNEFERDFIQSFPYYLGLTENAIQYLADTELDVQPQLVDSATICHARFHPSVWQDGIKLPTDWVFDHCTRDIAEWIRNSYFQTKNVNWEQIEGLLVNYVRAQPLSTFSWRLLYSRLLFPVHYFEAIEEYYLKGQLEKDGKKLTSIVHNSREYEQFLSQVNETLQTRFSLHHGFPKVPWLKKA